MTPQAAGWDRGVPDAWAHVVQTVPKIGAFAFIMICGGLAARALTRIVNRLLDHAGADNLLDRGGLPRALHRPARDLRLAMMRLVLTVALLTLLQLAVGILGVNPVSDLVHGLVLVLAHALLACAILAFGATIASSGRTFVSRTLTGLPYAGTATTIAAGVIMICFGKAALDEIGLATSVTTPMLYALLATAAGVTIVGVGGGLIRPMQRRWEEILRRAGPELIAAQSTWRDNRARAAAEEPIVVPVNDLAGVSSMVTISNVGGRVPETHNRDVAEPGYDPGPALAPDQQP